VQTLALNLFDNLGHGLHFMLVGVQDASEGGGECGHYSAGPDYPKADIFGPGRTTDVREAVHCVAALGDVQPDINFDLGLGRYDKSVCPDGSTNLALCDPTLSSGSRRRAAARGVARPQSAPQGTLPGDAVTEEDKELRDILGLPPKLKLPPKLRKRLEQQLLNQPDAEEAAANDLLNFLLGP